MVRTHLNVYKIPENITVIPVNKDSLKTFTPGVDTFSFVLVNSSGDTIPTGVPIPAKGKVVSCIQSQPVKVLPLPINYYTNINIKSLDVDQGMNSPFIWSIIEDSHSNLWFGTYYGVSMYNGESFTHFTEEEGLSDNNVESILEDRYGNIWFSHYLRTGVSIYNGETFTIFTDFYRKLSL